MKRLFAILLGSFVTRLIWAQSHFSYATSLSGDQSRPLPPAPSLATGTAGITLDILPAFTTMTWDIRWTGLSGLPTAAHFHGPAGPEASAAALFALGNFFSDSTPSSGGYSGFRQLTDPAQISAIREGLAYVDLHTEIYPAGEIRGQLRQVPEPSPWALAAVLAAGMGFVKVWRTRREITPFSQPQVRL